jgi:ABC-type sugar transport system substrate-binding protein
LCPLLLANQLFAVVTQVVRAAVAGAITAAPPLSIAWQLKMMTHPWWTHLQIVFEYVEASA